jgi:hypothetical protein
MPAGFVLFKSGVVNLEPSLPRSHTFWRRDEKEFPEGVYVKAPSSFINAIPPQSFANG